MMRKMAFVLLFFSNSKTNYYKLINLDNGQGCLQAYTTKFVANKFGATEGSCKEIDCTIPYKEKNIDFIGTVKSFYC